MLTTRQKVLRRFWYATVKLGAIAAGPVPFRLMGEDIVIFAGADGAPVALRDRCCHRTAKLSRGWVEGGQIVCGYHGWTYGSDGKLARIPQFEPDRKLPDHRVESFHCQARYGYVWVALGEPLLPLFEIPEDADPGYRRIFQFYEPWETAPLRFLENSFDNAHFAFAHRATFGDAASIKPKKYEIIETDEGFRADSVVDILNPPIAHRVTGTTDAKTERRMRNAWYVPFSRRLDMEYPSGIRHIIINCATPVEDGRIQLIQLLYRNDTEADCPESLLVEWDEAIIAEDRILLEATSPDAILDVTRGIEQHMPSDRPGLIMRRRLLDLLRAHGEDEITLDYA